MVTNGYGVSIAQLICEVTGHETLLGMKSDEIVKIFEEWNKGR